MHRYLEQIIASRRRRVAEDMEREGADRLAAKAGRCGSPEDPVQAIRNSGGLLIGEIKRASPSRGPLVDSVDVASRARCYELGGAGAVSVLCEPDFFKGSRADVATAAGAVSIPVLCKDFVVDPYQLLQAKLDGARWVLLIARVLGDALVTFVGESLAVGLEPLVEVHSAAEMGAASSSGARLIGVNSRDLDTFSVDLSIVRELAAKCPDGCACIAESGITSAGDLLSLREAGAHGFLIGEVLMRSTDPRGMLEGFARALRGDGGER